VNRRDFLCASGAGCLALLGAKPVSARAPSAGGTIMPPQPPIDAAAPLFSGSALLDIRTDFNRYHEEQRFLGLNALILANAAQDPAMLDRRLSMAVFSRVGLPASRVVHARVFVNDEYVGLYEVVEAVEKPFLARVFGRDGSARKRDEGCLFEYKWETDYQWTYLGPDLGRYAPLFGIQTRQMDAPSLVYGPVEGMIRTINEVSDRDFDAEVARYLHIQLFIRHLAAEHLISDIDGFLGDWGPNNVCLYRFEDGTLSAIIPRDKDSTFYDLLDDIYKGFDRSVPGQRILPPSALRRCYLESLLGCDVAAVAVRAPVPALAQAVGYARGLWWSSGFL
jgi:hypothetical protein